MVRVLFIRHTETFTNVGFQGTLYAQTHHLLTNAQLQERSTLTAQAYETRRISHNLETGAPRRILEVGEDEITPRGVEMMMSLADRWAPVLSPLVPQDKLKFIVSPALRTMKTVDDLITRLGCTAVLDPRICELPASIHWEDQRLLFDKLFPLLRRGETTKAKQLLQERIDQGPWKKGGLTGTELTQLFPWARLNPSTSLGPTFKPVPMTEGWCEWGLDYMEDLLGLKKVSRFSEVCTWLKEEARTTMKDDAVIVIVSHGNTIARMVTELCSPVTLHPGTLSFHNFDNTSVSSIVLHDDNYKNHNGIPMPGAIVVEFLNRVDHLYTIDPRFGDRNGSFLNHSGLMNAGSIQKEHGDYVVNEYHQLKKDEETNKSHHQHHFEPFYFVTAADCQFGMYKKNKSWKEEQETLAKAIVKINQMTPPPAFVSMCGDLIHAYPTPEDQTNDTVRAEQTKSLKQTLSLLRKDVPFVCVCGNHDVGNTPTSETLRNFEREWGKDHYDFYINSVRFICLNSQLYKDASKTKIEAREQHDWLKKVLYEEKPRHLPSIVFSHIPPFIHNENEKESWANWPVEERKEVLGLAKDAGVKSWFAGHYHQNAGGFVADGSLEVVVTSSVGTTIDSKGHDLSQGVLPSSDGIEMKIGEDVSGFRLVRVSESRGVEHKWFTLNEMPTSIISGVFGTDQARL